MSWDSVLELVQTVGAIVALVVGAVTGWIEVARFRRERRHARAEVLFWQSDPDIDGTAADGQVVARLWVGARRFYLVHAWLYVGDYGTDGRPYEEQRPSWLEAGQSLEFRKSLRRLLYDASSAYDEFGPRPMPERDEERVSVAFECGEGERHSARLSRTDRKQLRRVLQLIRNHHRARDAAPPAPDAN